MSSKKESLPHGRNVVVHAIESMEGYEALHGRFVRTMSISGKSRGTIENYSRHVASIALHFGQIPLDLSVEEVHAYLYALQKRAKIPSRTYMMYAVHFVRFSSRLIPFIAKNMILLSSAIKIEKSFRCFLLFVKYSYLCTVN